jgi:hypothetical protein
LAVKNGVKKSDKNASDEQATVIPGINPVYTVE